jgi:hypothetical protein
MSPGRVLGAALVGLAAGLAACSSVLGLDAPTLDPCASGGCVDAPVQLDASDAAVVDVVDHPDVAQEAESDGASCFADAQYEAGTGVRCGGGCYPTVYCTGSTPICCQSTDDLGATTFQCKASESACGGYSIDCVNENDCSGSEVCCHYSTHAVCAGSCTSNSDIACLPGSTDDCPTGWKCVGPVDIEGVASPYYTCQQ